MDTLLITWVVVLVLVMAGIGMVATWLGLHGEMSILLTATLLFS
jgi:hypothetical protein